jgi:hypothetical protein
MADQVKLNLADIAPLPENLTKDERWLIGEAVIEFIRERTAAGHNKFHRKWAGEAGKYTDAYKAASGKTEPVDLLASGDMLEALTVLKNSPDNLEIGIKRSDENFGKALGNILGSYGREPNAKKARPFLEILKRDLLDIYREFT